MILGKGWIFIGVVLVGILCSSVICGVKGCFLLGRVIFFCCKVVDKLLVRVGKVGGDVL